MPTAIREEASIGIGGPAGADTTARQGPKPTIVLVHGDWADAAVDATT